MNIPSKRKQVKKSIMEGKKISFGFMKTKKVDKRLTPIIKEDTKEYIECVEEKSIKVVGGEVETNEEPLVIPMKPNTLITAERLKEIADKVESAVADPEINEELVIKKEPIEENETLDQMAVRELIQEAEKEVKVESNDDMAIPAPTKTVLAGEKESTLDDYESVPIQHFGMAMLRGMGWKPSKDGSKYKQPELRPKGLGLGADKVIKDNQKKQTKDKREEELVIVKNSFVKITTGKYSGFYGKVVSLDEDNGRVMVDIPVKKETISLSEFMMHAVTKSEYDRESKVINADSYEEYKKTEKVNQKAPTHEERGSTSHRNNDLTKHERERSSDDQSRHKEDKSSNGRSRDKVKERGKSSSSEDRPRREKKKDKKKYSSNDSLSSLSDDDRRRRKYKSKSRRHRSGSEDSRKRSPDGKRDIDKKRKGKKKKRDRDRSPNYKKHRNSLTENVVAAEPTPGPSGVQSRPMTLVEQMEEFKVAKALDAKNLKKISPAAKKQLAELREKKQLGFFKMPDAPKPKKGKGNGKGQNKTWIPCPLLPGIPAVPPPHVPQPWEIRRDNENRAKEAHDITEEKEEEEVLEDSPPDLIAIPHRLLACKAAADPDSVMDSDAGEEVPLLIIPGSSTAETVPSGTPRRTTIPKTPFSPSTGIIQCAVSPQNPLMADIEFLEFSSPSSATSTKAPGSG